MKRLSANFGAPEYQWNELYYPTLESADNDASREAVIEILDAIACPEVAAYLQGIFVDSDSALRPAAISALKRWPLQESLDDGDLWVAIASAESATDKERSDAARSLKKLLTHRSHPFYPAQADLLVTIVQADLPLEYKRDLLTVYENPAKHFSVAHKRRLVTQRLKVVENDPQVGDMVKQITRKL